MSHFLPTRTVVAPDGRDWEIYVSRFESPSWRLAEVPSITDERPGVSRVRRLLIVRLLVDLPLFTARAAVRLFATVTASVARGLRSRTLWVEAISFFPWEESHVWETTPDHLESVLWQVERSLADGAVGHLVAARHVRSREAVASRYRELRS